MAMTPYRSGKKTKEGTSYLYYNACVDYTKDGSLTTCPIKMLPAREFEALIRQVLADLRNQPAILQACVDAANHEALESVAGGQPLRQVSAPGGTACPAALISLMLLHTPLQVCGESDIETIFRVPEDVDEVHGDATWRKKLAPRAGFEPTT